MTDIQWGPRIERSDEDIAARRKPGPDWLTVQGIERCGNVTISEIRQYVWGECGVGTVLAYRLPADYIPATEEGARKLVTRVWGEEIAKTLPAPVDPVEALANKLAEDFNRRVGGDILVVFIMEAIRAGMALVKEGGAK